MVEWWENLDATPRLVTLAAIGSLVAGLLVWIGFPYAREIALSALIALMFEALVLAVIASRGHGFTSSQFRWSFIVVVFVGGFLINRILDGSQFEGWVLYEYATLSPGTAYLVAWVVSATLLGVVTWMVIEENHN